MKNIDEELVEALSKIYQKLQKPAQDVSLIKNQDTQITYSVTQTARKCECSRGTVRNLYERGEIKGFQEKVGGKIYLYSDSVRVSSSDESVKTFATE
uniref:Helix-turn-helix domain-containing protein n=1 Tax=Roseihalotalea indica TaxID=2867963 RepID=A0AA49JKD4_9BACT|nr:hypothetical protein K4G66_16480 [Tunicatimonas sp. TK19036]